MRFETSHLRCRHSISRVASRLPPSRARWSSDAPSQQYDTSAPSLQVLAAMTACCFLASPVSIAMAEVPMTTAPGTNIGFETNEAVDKKRDEFQMKRSYDGHVALRNKATKSFWDVKLDMASPGTLLFREPESGEVYILGFTAFQQVDLSDDDTVAAISADAWEKKIVPVQSDDQPPVKLEVTREGFFNLISVVDPELE